MIRRKPSAIKPRHRAQWIWPDSFYRTGGGKTSGTPAPVITSSLMATCYIGSAFSYQITATNNPTSFNATNLPTGLSVNTTTGVISGTPTGSGQVASVPISATNAGGTGQATLTLTVFDPSQLPNLAAWYKSTAGLVTDGAVTYAAASSQSMTIASNSTLQIGTFFDGSQSATITTWYASLFTADTASPPATRIRQAGVDSTGNLSATPVSTTQPFVVGADNGGVSRFYTGMATELVLCTPKPNDTPNLANLMTYFAGQSGLPA